MGDAPEDSAPGGSARSTGANRRPGAPDRTRGSAKGQRNQGGGGGQAGGGKAGGGKAGGGNRGGGNNRNRNGGSRNRNGNHGGRSGSSGPGRPGNGGSSKGSPARHGGADAPTDPRRSAGGASATPAPDRSGERNEEESARVNRRRAVAICLVPGVIVGAVVGAVVALVGLAVVGVVVFVVVAVGGFAWLWRWSPAAVLRSVEAVPSDEWEHPRLHNLVDGLCATMGLPRPAIWVVDSPVPNAMAVGRDPSTASLVVTSGLEQSLSLVELEGVLAHELVHIKRRDTVVAGAAVAAVALFLPFVGLERASDRVHSLVGRGREFSADQRAAGVVRYPPGITSALDAMAGGVSAGAPWPPGTGRRASLTRWLWIDPMAGSSAGEPLEGNLDDTRVRAAAGALD
ncbi:MAG TPA: M48 family metalloprotease [Acidimicrobiales bacterium]